MLNILLSGCRGKLCASVAECADGQTDLRVVGGIDRASGQAMPFPVFSAPETVALPDANRPNVVIDCSHPSALPGLLAFCVEQRCPLVVATTGYGENEQALLAEAGRSIPIFYGRNMSLGINLLRELVKSAARVLGSDFDVEIVESHHSQKIDAPSGTALILAEAINEAMEV
ncbi:MAG: 4-hydroxy-tetrahydrodipicolinate reductase, partial [Oscillospiraceae bacterium]|nr:4-hydroxy-tetrahydrodipicolinate reductase [Oscillospiraceae bacterium]